MDLRVGINVRGHRGLVVDRPHGAGEFVFVQLLDVAILGRAGTRRVEPGTCIVFGPETPTYIAGADTIYNNFLHFSLDLGEEPMRRYGVPLDQPFVPQSTDFVLPLLSRLQREWVQRDRHWEDAIRLCVTDLLLCLARGVAEHAAPAMSRHANRLRKVRLAVHRAPTEPWTVASMAALAHLKETQFSVLYKRLFGRSPIDDLIQVRVELAKYYLANYELSVGEIAHMCGFADPAYFSRRFRRDAGVPPSVFGRRARSYPPKLDRG